MANQCRRDDTYLVRFGGITDIFCFDHCPRIGDIITLSEEETQQICDRKRIPLLPRVYKVVAVVHRSSEKCADRSTELILEPAAESLVQLRMAANDNKPGLLRLKELTELHITDEYVESVEKHLGQSHLDWDMVSAKSIIATVLKNIEFLDSGKIQDAYS